METITHREMRNNSAEVLRRVEAGEVLQVSNNGRLAAVISPASTDVLDGLLSRGQARPARRGVETLKSIRRAASVTTTAELLADARGRR